MSKPSKIIASILLGVMLVLVFSLDFKTRSTRRQMTCSGIQIEILDSAELGFISAKEIQKIIDKEYGIYTGVALDSLNLRKIEEILENKSSILHCEAYITANGKLNVNIEEREPVIKLTTRRGSFFIDDTGYLFPSQSNYDKKLQEIIGNFTIEPDWKGVLASPKQRYWLNNLLKMIHYMESEKTWENAFQTIEADKRGNISLKPKTGKETFLFGPPDNYEVKFGKIKDYYRYIVNLKGEGYYTKVSVKNDGQIVCK